LCPGAQNGPAPESTYFGILDTALRTTFMTFASVAAMSISPFTQTVGALQASGYCAMTP